MKVGKEAIMGLLAALEQYENKDKQAEVAKNVKIVDWLVDEINQIPNLKAQKIQDEAGRAIFRARVFVDPEKAGMTATELEGKLKDVYKRQPYNGEQKEGGPCTTRCT